MKTLHINFWAGPGTGKSTIAAAIFANLKWLDKDCELISEYAKDMVWEESFKKLTNQIYIFSKQHKKHFVLDGKVDYVITDSAIPLTCIYDNDTKYLKELVLSEFNKFNNLNILLKRTKKYNTNGRTQTFDEAISVDNKILNFMKNCHIPYYELDATPDCVQQIMDIIKNTKPMI